MTLKRHESTTVNSIPRRNIPTETGPKSPPRRLGQAVIFGVLLFVAFSSVIITQELNIGPFGLPLILGACSAWTIYGISLIGMDIVVLTLEHITNRDIDGDGQVGQPVSAPADRLVPVFYDRNTKVVDEPETPQIDEDDRPLRLLPSARAMPKHEIFDYVDAAFVSGDWTRDGRPGNINTKAWADVRGFVKAYYPRVWETTDRPTLDWFVRKIRNTGTNGTERNERNDEE